MRIAKALIETQGSHHATHSAADVRELLELRQLLQQGRVPEAIERALASLDHGGGPLLELARHCAESGRPRLALDLLGIISGMRPDLMATLESRSFRALRDDPRFLQMIGEL